MITSPLAAALLVFSPIQTGAAQQCLVQTAPSEDVLPQLMQPLDEEDGLLFVPTQPEEEQGPSFGIQTEAEPKLIPLIWYVDPAEKRIQASRFQMV